MFIVVVIVIFVKIPQTPGFGKENPCHFHAPRSHHPTAAVHVARHDSLHLGSTALDWPRRVWRNWSSGNQVWKIMSHIYIYRWLGSLQTIYIYTYIYIMKNHQITFLRWRHVNQHLGKVFLIARCFDLFSTRKQHGEPSVSKSWPRSFESCQPSVVTRPWPHQCVSRPDEWSGFPLIRRLR